MKKKVLSIVLAFVMVIALPLTAYLSLPLFRKDNDGGENNNGNNNPSSGSLKPDVKLASRAITEICSINHNIFNDYSLSSESEISTYSSSSLSENKINMYFSSLAECFMLPSAMEYIIKNSTEEKPFELNQTYYANFDRLLFGHYDNFRYKVEMVDSMINIYMMKGLTDFTACQIEYDFDENKVISLKTVWDYGAFAILDYENNNFSFAEFGIHQDLYDIVSGKYEKQDIIISEFNYIYNANIATNINNIVMNKVNLTVTEDDRDIIDNFVNKFNFKPSNKTVLDYYDYEINNLMFEAELYLNNRLYGYSVRRNEYNQYVFDFVYKWTEFNETIDLLNNLSQTDLLGLSQNEKNLIGAYKNYLLSKGKVNFFGVGEFDFEKVNSINNDYLRIHQTEDEYNSFILTTLIAGVAHEYCFQYLDGQLIEKGQEYIKVDIIANKISDGYASISRIYTTGMLVNIPETVEIDGETLIVKELIGFRAESSIWATIINIPKTVESIVSNGHGSYFDPNAIFIKVDKNNNHYSSSYWGELFNYGETELIKYPSFRKVDNYTPNYTIYKIYDGAFSGARYLEEVNFIDDPIPFREYEIDFDQCFSGALALKEINIESYLEMDYVSYDGIVYSKNGETLIYCPTRRQNPVNVKNGTKVISENAFVGCSYIKKITFPSGLTTLGSLRGCYSLKSLNIPATVTDVCDTYLESYETLECLSEIVVEEGNPLFFVDEQGLLYNADKTILYFCPKNYEGVVNILDTVEIIEKCAFEKCRKITEITIPESVTEIKNYAFRLSSVEKISILGSVYFGFGVFDDCKVNELIINGLRLKEYGNEYAMKYSDIVGCYDLKVINFGGSKDDWLELFYNDREYSNSPKIIVYCLDGVIHY